MAAKAVKPALMGGAMVAVALSLPLLGAASAQNTLSGLVAQGGVQGEIMFLGLASLLTAIGLPRQVPAFVAGYAFGLWSGIAMALLSQLIACTVDFVWARAVARDFVARRLGKRLQKLDAMLAAKPFMTTLTFRLMPVGNNLILNLVAGMSSVRAVPFLAASLLGFIPQTAVFALLGRGSVPSHADKLALGAGMFLVSAALGVVLLLKYRREAA
jgi:uncharacterized membrane protein YdjX (TVP38/TMEM64 family)